MQHRRARWWVAFAALSGLAPGCASTADTRDVGVAPDAAMDAPDDANAMDAVPAADIIAPDVPARDVTPDVVPGDHAGPRPARGAPTQGSAIALSADGRVAVAVNRTADSVSVFTLDPAATPARLTRIGAPLSTGPASEPWSVVLSNDGDAAYVALRRAQQVLRVEGLRSGAPAIAAARVATGSEPTGVAISPGGARLFVANHVEGTVTVVDAVAMRALATVDLNAALASSGLLGTVTPRPALAHPRAVVVSDDGDADDADESAYVTEFFSQARPGALPADDRALEVGRVGVVYRFDLRTLTVGPVITLAPVDDTGFTDSDGAVTGCFPNQLYAVAIQGGTLRVTGVCESPRGPIGVRPPAAPGAPPAESNVRTMLHAAVFAVDLATGAERPDARVLLTREFARAFPASAPADDGALHRVPLIPGDIAFVPGAPTAYVSAYGSEALFRVAYRADGALESVGADSVPFVNLQPSDQPAGRLPIGVALTPDGQSALVLNESSRNVSVVALATQRVVAVVESAPPPAAGTREERVNLGRRVCVTGLTRWSLRGQGWSSCESCHPDGLSDQVTWYFPRGPRQTIPLDGTYGPSPAGQARILNWTATSDEVHDFELVTRDLSGGVGAVVNPDRAPITVLDRVLFTGAAGGSSMSTTTRQDGLNGAGRALMPGAATPASVTSVRADWDRIDDYVRSVRAPRAVVGLAPAAVVAGRMLFQQANCAACHGQSNWTLSRVFYAPGEAHNNPLTGDLLRTAYTAQSAFPRMLNPPTDNAARSAPLRAGTGTMQFDSANDQLWCVLRAVGTFPAALDATRSGVVPPGSPLRVREVRGTDMVSVAQGSTGYNPPSLLSAVVGAPYFHAGNARTLEELFSPTFEAHYAALSSSFLLAPITPELTRELVAFLLSIDDATAPVPTGPIGFNTDLCPSSL